MNTLKILGIVLIFGVIMTFGSEIGEQLSIPGAQHLVPTAEAVVGRPLTPVSVAGVARRTVRRPPPLSEMPRPGTPDPEYEAVLEAELDWAEAYFGQRPISAFELANHPELADGSESNPDAGSAEDGAERLVLESDA